MALYRNYQKISLTCFLSRNSKLFMCWRKPLSLPVVNTISVSKRHLFILNKTNFPSTQPQTTKYDVAFDTKKSGKLKHFFKENAEVEENDEGDTPSIIYIGELTNQIRRVKLFSLSTSVLGLCFQPLLISQAGETPLAATIAALTFVGFFTFVTPFLINMISKRYVCEMSYDPATKYYTSTTYNFFLQKRLLTFQPVHVKVPDVPGPFTTFLVNLPDGTETALFLAPTSFLKRRHYAKLMGYDKPLNLYLTEEDVKKSDMDKNKSSSSHPE